MFNRRVYLDCAAGLNSNPSSPHTEGRKSRERLENSRVEIARLIEAQADDVIFTSGATESNALAIIGHVRALRAQGMKYLHVLYLPSSHASVVENMKLLAEEWIVIEELPVKDARVDIEVLKKMLRPETVLVSMDAVCGETGVVWNTREVREAIGSKIMLHVDASQAPLTEKITRAHFGADMLTFDGSKVCVRGIGVLIAHRTIPIVPLYVGGGQERGLRSGTEVPEAAEKFADNLQEATLNHDKFRASAERIRTEFLKAIGQMNEVYVNEGRTQAPNILNLSLVGRDTDYLVALLDESGFAVSTRSACETDSEAGSRAVFVLTRDIERSRSTLRISWCSRNSSRELKRFLKALQESLSFIDSSVKR
jgi:cysteine desulfurase